MNGLGDFQTPPALAGSVLRELARRGVEPGRILEPTCGSGAFLAASAAVFPTAELVGIEFQRDRYGEALDALRARLPRLTVQYANAYEIDFAALPWSGRGPLLLVGNPPWVTSAALGRARSGALQPPRSNPKALRGLAARTGAANFDVAEFLLLKVLREVRAEPLHLAMLVKECVARNIIACADRLALGITDAEIVRIDAHRWFGVSVDACCLVLSTVPGGRVRAPVPVRPDFAREPCATFAPTAPRPADSSAPVFRQGIKHDAAAVFELRAVDGEWQNGYGEIVDIEQAYLYPLLKARDLHRGDSSVARALVVPQLQLGERTERLQHEAPRLWRYLERHAERIGSRKSSIYRGAPRFALFGVGPYSFAPWKVAVAGFYPHARFRVVGPRGGRPVVFGDTAYFAPFAAEASARAFGALCASPRVSELLAGRVIPGKRPITKALLDGIDWTALAARSGAATPAAVATR